MTEEIQKCINNESHFDSNKLRVIDKCMASKRLSECNHISLRAHLDGKSLPYDCVAIYFNELGGINKKYEQSKTN